jgi:hypothetical protein
MMTLGRGLRGDAGAPEQAATHGAADALIVTSVSSSMRAGTTASASAARASAFPPASAARGCASPPPSPVKHFNVRRAADGPTGARAAIAARTPGADGRLMEIRSLGKGRPRPNGAAGEGTAIMAEGVPTAFAAAGLGTGLSRFRTGAPGRQRRAPPGRNPRQATLLAPS